MEETKTEEVTQEPKLAEHELIIEEINSLDLITTPTSELIKFNKFSLDTPEHTAIRKALILKLCSEVFGSNFELQGTSIVTHFPEVDILNSNGNSYKIYDLFIKLTFNDKFKLTRRRFSGFRTTYTYLDFSRSGTDSISNIYVHSHLPSIEPDVDEDDCLDLSGILYAEWEFCVGDDTPMSEDLNHLRLEGFEILSLRKILFNLISYIPWESREGGPYRYFEDLHYPSNGGTDANIRLFNTRDELKNFLFNNKETLKSLNLIFQQDAMLSRREKAFKLDEKQLSKVLDVIAPNDWKVAHSISGEIMNSGIDFNALKNHSELIEECFSNNEHFFTYQGRKYPLTYLGYPESEIGSVNNAIFKVPEYVVLKVKNMLEYLINYNFKNI